jgi:S-adenosylmethionine decarboxylase
MAFNDALFQLGMDLTRSSPAQKEDLNEVVRGAHNGDAHVAHQDREVCFAERESAHSGSQRVAIDLIGSKRIETAKAVEQALRQALESAKGKLRGFSLSRDKQSGRLKGIATLADGHVSFETWPAKGFTAIDLFSTGGIRPEIALTALANAFDAREAVITKRRSPSMAARLPEALPLSEPAPARKAPATRIAKIAKARRAA